MLLILIILLVFYLWDPDYFLPPNIPKTSFFFLLRVTKAMYSK